MQSNAVVAYFFFFFLRNNSAWAVTVAYIVIQIAYFELIIHCSLYLFIHILADLNRKPQGNICLYLWDSRETLFCFIFSDRHNPFKLKHQINDRKKSLEYACM